MAAVDRSGRDAGARTAARILTNRIDNRWRADGRLAHEDALRFSFLLATPIIAAAAALKLPILFASGNRRAIETALLGAACAAIAAYFSVKFLTKYFKTRTLLPFAIYCLLSGLISILLLHRWRA